MDVGESALFGCEGFGCENILLKEFGELGKGYFLGNVIIWEMGFLGKEVFFGKRIWKEDYLGIMWILCGDYVEGVIWERMNKGRGEKRKG